MVKVSTMLELLDRTIEEEQSGVDDYVAMIANIEETVAESKIENKELNTLLEAVEAILEQESAHVQVLQRHRQHLEEAHRFTALEKITGER